MNTNDLSTILLKAKNTQHVCIMCNGLSTDIDAMVVSIGLQHKGEITAGEWYEGWDPDAFEPGPEPQPSPELSVTGIKFACESPTNQSTLSFHAYDSYDSEIETWCHVQYSYDGKTWNNWDVDNVSLNFNGSSSHSIYVRANPNSPNEDGFCIYDEQECIAAKYHAFSIGGEQPVSASGNIQYLLDSTGNRTDVPDYGFMQLFYNCVNLVTSPQLNARTLGCDCYECMFCGCSDLLQAPNLPAETLTDFCYCDMFDSCTSLTSTPVLSSTSLALGCYCQMFSDCDGLVSAFTLPSMTLAEYCYAIMFNGCKSLQVAPQLPANELAQECYYHMFHDCIALTSVPSISVKTLGDECLNGMFYNCSSLKVSENGEVGSKILEIPAGTLSALSWNSNMFRGTAGTFTGDPSIGNTYYCYN